VYKKEKVYKELQLGQSKFYEREILDRRAGF
jgi:hypothetical protein